VIRYQSRRDDDGALRLKLRELAHQRRRLGCCWLHILLRREGLTINRTKTRRLDREEGLTVRRRTGRKRAVGISAPNHVGSHADINPAMIAVGRDSYPATLLHAASMAATAGKKSQAPRLARGDEVLESDCKGSHAQTGQPVSYPSPKNGGEPSPPRASYRPSRPLLTRMLTETRRFWALPSAVSLLASGSASAMPVGVSMR
jgi:hypothetical protein